MLVKVTERVKDGKGEALASPAKLPVKPVPVVGNAAQKPMGISPSRIKPMPVVKRNVAKTPESSSYSEEEFEKEEEHDYKKASPVRNLRPNDMGPKPVGGPMRPMQTSSQVQQTFGK